MATLNDYLDIAQFVYRANSDGKPSARNRFRTTGGGSWTVQKWEFATWWGNGYQGGVFVGANEIVVGFSGTKGDIRTAPISQNTANMRIGIQVIPNMARSAFHMVRWAQKNANGRPVSIVGHSLGGGLAQVVGNWADALFISFNGPGMYRHLRGSSFNIFKPMQMRRSLKSGSASSTVGLSFIVVGDFVATFGRPLGTPVMLTVAAGTVTHDLDSIEDALRQKRWLNKTPSEVFDAVADAELGDWIDSDLAC